MTTGLYQQDEATLRRCLEHVLADLEPAGARVVGVRQERATCATSHHASVLTVQFSTGEEVKLFLKDFRFSRLPGDGLRQRAERELRVYRDLLAGADLGTARYCGSASDEEEGRLLLVLEYVDGLRLRSCELDAWVAAAHWLGRMQAYFARHPERWRACDVLLRHDADFFFARAEGAVRAVSGVAPHLAGRLDDVVKDYARFVDVMTGQPRGLVHGSYRPQNLLVSPVTGRVCPVDWELAAVGAPLYDLAFLSDGFRPPERDRLRHAYLEAAGDACRPTRGREEMRYVVDCFRLHKVLKSLSEARDKHFPEPTVAKLLRQAEELGILLAQGAPEEEGPVA
jgi:hypothetical protein